MYLLRHRLVLRCVATLLLAGVVSTLAPTAAAQESRAGAFALLDDAAAFDAALAASAQAEPGEDPIEVFVQTYVQATGGDVSAETVRRLIDGPSLGLVAPPARPTAFVPAPPAGPAPTPGTAVLQSESAPLTVAAIFVQTSPDAPEPPAKRSNGPRQPRAP